MSILGANNRYVTCSTVAVAAWGTYSSIIIIFQLSVHGKTSVEVQVQT